MKDLSVNLGYLVMGGVATYYLWDDFLYYVPWYFAIFLPLLFLVAGQLLFGQSSAEPTPNRRPYTRMNWHNDPNNPSSPVFKDPFDNR